MYIKSLTLSEEDLGQLVRIVKRGRDWCTRERTQTLLNFDAGWEAKAIAVQQELHLDMVYDQRKYWLKGSPRWRTNTAVGATEAH